MGNNKKNHPINIGFEDLLLVFNNLLFLVNAF